MLVTGVGGADGEGGADVELEETESVTPRAAHRLIEACFAWVRSLPVQVALMHAEEEARKVPSLQRQVSSVAKHPSRLDVAIHSRAHGGKV